MKLLDTHFHIFDLQYSLVSSLGALFFLFIGNDYNRGYKLVNKASVSSSFQIIDQTYLIDALQQLGKNYIPLSKKRLKIKPIGLRILEFNQEISIK